MYTSNPVLVIEQGKERQIRPTEAEALMGYPRGYTREARHEVEISIVPDIDRLRKMGAGVDVRQLTQIMKRIQRYTPAHAGKPNAKERTEAPVGPTQENVHIHVVAHE